MDNYEKLLERISRSSGFSKEEIEKKIEAKKAKLSGLISKEGAAQIVAAELGINFAQERLKISELVEGMKKANILGKVIKISPIREFNKNGREGRVVNLTIGDETSNVRVVLWDTNHISLIEKGKIKEKSVIEVSNASMRNWELHLNSFSELKISNEKIDSVITEKAYAEKLLSEIKPGESIKTRATIIKTFDPRYFEVCPECGKRALDEECKIHGKISPQKRAVLTLIIDDGADSIKASLFSQEIRLLGLKDEEIFSLEEFNKIKNKFLGEEKIFFGNIKNNSLYSTIDFSIEKIESPDLDLLIKDLEAKIV